MNPKNVWRWERLEALLMSINPDMHGALRPPASLDQIRTVEKEAGLVFPDDLRDAYLRHDGIEHLADTGLLRFFPNGMSWMPLEGLLDSWRHLSEMFSDFHADDYERYLDEMYEYPDLQVRLHGPLKEWIPIGSGSGAKVCIDLLPGPAGVAGQLVYHDFTTGSEVIANGFGAYLDLLITGLASGTAGWFDGVLRVPGGSSDVLDLTGVPSGRGDSRSTAMDAHLSPPSIVHQPTPACADAGTNATFSVSATGAGNLRYQWHSNGLAVPGGDASEVQLLAEPAAIGQSIQITVQVSNAAGIVTSDAVSMTVTHPIGGVSVEEHVDAAKGRRIVTRRRAGLTVPPGALIADARVRLVCEQADRLGIASEFIPIGDAITLDTGGVEFSQALELELAWSDDVDGDKVLGLLELGGTVAGGGGAAAASTPVIRVLGLSACHGGYGSVIVGLERPGRYLLAQVPEGSITGELE